MVYMKQMGARVKRKEDPRLITGRSTYVDDLRPRDLGHVAILRSTEAHAIIRRIDTTAAEALPGVIAVYTGERFRSLARPLPFGGEDFGAPKGMVPIDTPILTDERVRHVGQAIAVVVANDPYLAQDALELIEVEYEPLSVVTDLEAAAGSDAP